MSRIETSYTPLRQCSHLKESSRDTIIRDKIHSPTSLTRKNVAIEIGNLGNETEKYLPELMYMLTDDGYKEVRAEAAKAIGNAGEAAEVAIKSLTEALKDPYEKVRLYSVKALGFIGNKAKDSVPKITGVLSKDCFPHIRSNAAWALGLIGENGEACTPFLIKALNDQYPLVRASAAGALGAFKNETKTFIDPLMTIFLSDKDYIVRKYAEWSLRGLQEPHIINFINYEKDKTGKV